MIDKITPLGLISLFNFITCLLLGLFLIAKNRQKSANIFCALFDFSIAGYAFFYFLWQCTTNYEWGIVYFKFCICGVVLINSAFVHFVFVFLDKQNMCRKNLFIVHAINAVFCYAAFGLFYADWKVKYAYGLWPIPSNIFHIYLVWWFAQVIYCFRMLHSDGVKKAVGYHRSELRWIFWSSLAAYCGGATNWFVWYNIPFPPYCNAGIAVYAIILSFAIMRYHVFNIEALIDSFQRERLATLGMLMASINHEIKNPLYIIQGLMQNYDDAANARLTAELCVSVRNQITRILDVISRFNEFAKPPQLGSIDKQTVNLADALSVVLGFVDAESKKNNINIETDLPEHLPPLQFETKQLESVLFNLVVNACQAMQRNGQLKIKAVQTRDRVLVSITDTGPGMSAHFQKDLFKPFRTTKGERGTGLGLYITKQLVERYGGRIEVESNPGKGTSVILGLKAVG